MVLISYKHSLTNGLKFPSGYQKDLKLELFKSIEISNTCATQNEQQYQAATFDGD